MMPRPPLIGATHGVSFEYAVKVFQDRFAVERFDDREDYGEERINLLGISDGVILHVTDLHRTWRADQDHLGAASKQT